MTVPDGEVLESLLALTTDERGSLRDLLSGLLPDPYRHYAGFLSEVGRRGQSEQVPGTLREYARLRAAAADPVGLLTGAPVDDELPELDYDEPAISKYMLKKTFVAEGFLCLFGVLAGTPAVSHVNINDGDIFQDVRPKRSVAESQTQKALGGLVWHRDLSNHFVQPDHLYLLGLTRASDEPVWTAVASDEDVVRMLDPEVADLARQARFATPYRPIVVGGQVVSDPRPTAHPILSPAGSLQLMEGLTHGLDADADDALGRVIETVTRSRRLVDLGPGDFLTIQNQRCLHGRVVSPRSTAESLRRRWVMKTTNVNDLGVHAGRTFPGVPYLVRG